VGYHPQVYLLRYACLSNQQTINVTCAKVHCRVFWPLHHVEDVKDTNVLEECVASCQGDSQGLAPSNLQNREEGFFLSKTWKLLINIMKE
jgi:hypothetical protein